MLFLPSWSVVQRMSHYIWAPFFDCLMQQTAFIALQGELRPGVQRLRGNDAVRSASALEHGTHMLSKHTQTRTHARQTAVDHLSLSWLPDGFCGC